MDVHHTLFDGTSSKVFFGDILKAYFGQPLEPDYYYYNIRKREKQTWTPFYKECKDYFDKKYYSDGTIWQKYPEIDRETRENSNDEIFCNLPIDKKEYERLLKINSLTPNAFFITVNILATALYNRYKHIMVSWIYNGRVDMNEMSTVGLMFRNLPVGVNLKGKTRIKDLYTDVVEQINKGIEHSCYAAIEQNSSVVNDDMECVLYQDDLREIGEMPGLLGEVEIKHNNAASQNILDLEILNSPDGLQVMLDYASSRYNKASMEKYAEIMKSTVIALIRHADDDKATIKTVFAEVYSQHKFNRFFSKIFLFGWLE